MCRYGQGAVRDAYSVGTQFFGAIVRTRGGNVGTLWASAACDVRNRVGPTGTAVRKPVVFLPKFEKRPRRGPRLPIRTRREPRRAIHLPHEFHSGKSLRCPR